jgi:hypothetical protein
MRRETKRRKDRSSGVTGVQELQNGFADNRLAAGREFLACAPGSSHASSPPELLQLRNSCHSFPSRSCTNVFGGIGIKLGDRPFFGWLLDIVDVIPNDLLRLRVVNHH